MKAFGKDSIITKRAALDIIESVFGAGMEKTIDDDLFSSIVDGMVKDGLYEISEKEKQQLRALAAEIRNN